MPFINEDGSVSAPDPGETMLLVLEVQRRITDRLDDRLLGLETTTRRSTKKARTPSPSDPHTRRKP